jgi:homoprotocatechuate degradation regulator HpaR
MNDFDRSLPMMLYRTLDAVMPDFRQIFTQFDLTEQQWRVLRVLWESSEESMVKLSHATLIPSPSLVGVIDRLAKRDLVRRIPCDQDRRVVNLCLTEKGRDLEQRIRPAISTVYRNLEATLTTAQWRTLYTLLDKLVNKQPSNTAGEHHGHR